MVLLYLKREVMTRIKLSLLQLREKQTLRYVAARLDFLRLHGQKSARNFFP